MPLLVITYVNIKNVYEVKRKITIVGRWALGRTWVFNVKNSYTNKARATAKKNASTPEPCDRMRASLEVRNESCISTESHP